MLSHIKASLSDLARSIRYDSLPENVSSSRPRLGEPKGKQEGEVMQKHAADSDYDGSAMRTKIKAIYHVPFSLTQTDSDVAAIVLFAI